MDSCKLIFIMFLLELIDENEMSSLWQVFVTVYKQVVSGIGVLSHLSGVQCGDSAADLKSSNKLGRIQHYIHYRLCRRACKYSVRF